MIYKAPKIDRARIVELVGDEWSTVAEVATRAGQNQRTIQNILVDQWKLGVLACGDFILPGCKKRKAMAFRRIHGKTAIQTVRRQTVRQQRRNETATNQEKPPPPAFEIRYAAALIALEQLEQIQSHVLPPKPSAEHARPTAVYLKEWKALRRTWQPYTIPTEPVTTTDYEPAPDHPWRATQRRESA